MAEFINPNPQTVEVNANVLFTDTVVQPCPRVRHRRGSGIFTLKGGHYLIIFGANIAIPAGGTVDDLTLSIALNGEPLQGARMTVTPVAPEEFFNVSRAIYVDVPCNCCYTLSVRNVSEIPATVDDANLIIIREVA